jgi:SAM-dependent methyltransferase
VARRGGTALLVGCRRYTARDPALLEGHGVAAWTLDIDPRVARWGATGRHIIAPIQHAALHFRAAMFDTVLLSGVFGFGVDDVPAQEAAIAACATVLRPGGLLVLGWNADRVADPSTLKEIRRDFRSSGAAGLADRVAFDASTHIFDFYTRGGARGKGPTTVPTSSVGKIVVDASPT